MYRTRNKIRKYKRITIPDDYIIIANIVKMRITINNNKRSYLCKITLVVHTHTHIHLDYTVNAEQA